MPCREHRRAGSSLANMSYIPSRCASAVSSSSTLRFRRTVVRVERVADVGQLMPEHLLARTDSLALVTALLAPLDVAPLGLVGQGVDRVDLGQLVHARL